MPPFPSLTTKLGLATMGLRWTFLGWVVWAVGAGKPAKARPLPSGQRGLCVLGCTPYVATAFEVNTGLQCREPDGAASNLSSLEVYLSA